MPSHHGVPRYDGTKPDWMTKFKYLDKVVQHLGLRFVDVKGDYDPVEVHWVQEGLVVVGEGQYTEGKVQACDKLGTMPGIMYQGEKWCKAWAEKIKTQYGGYDLMERNCWHMVSDFCTAFGLSSLPDSYYRRVFVLDAVLVGVRLVNGAMEEEVILA